MGWRGSSEIEIPDLGDRLEVLARTRAGTLGWIVSAIVASAAEGNVPRAFLKQVTVSVDDIRSIGYFVGHEGDPGGRYAPSRWSQACLVPGLDEASCRRVQSAIEPKYPRMQFVRIRTDLNLATALKS